MSFIFVNWTHLKSIGYIVLTLILSGVDTGHPPDSGTVQVDTGPSSRPLDLMYPACASVKHVNPPTFCGDQRIMIEGSDISSQASEDVLVGER